MYVGTLFAHLAKTTETFAFGDAKLELIFRMAIVISSKI